MLTGSELGILAVLVGVLVIGVAWYFATYNSLVKSSTYVDEGFSQIDVQLQRRNDLIPNLVSTVKGYASHESGTLEAVVAARQQLINLPKDATPEQVNALSNELSGSLSRLLAVSEAYPDLKANTNFLQLQEELTTTENKISAARSYYNKLVASYNNKVKMVPSNIVANMAGYTVKEFLETPAEERKVPTVSFD